MCYTVAFVERKSTEYAKRYKNEVPIGWADIKNSNTELPLQTITSGFANPQLPIVTSQGITFAQWGLIPSWTLDQSQANEIKTKTLNAVGETVFEKKSYKHSILSKRCILPVNGFLDWRHLGKEKYPYLVKATPNLIFSLGCIYDFWKDDMTGTTIQSFSIITTPANLLMEKIHNTKKRMPLILNPHDEKNWINSEIDSHEILDLIKPFSDSQMTATSLNKNILSKSADSIDLLSPTYYPELELFDL